MTIVCLVNAYRSDTRGLLAAAAVARERRARLEVIAVVSPLRDFLLGMGALAPGYYSERQIDEELSLDLSRRLATLPADVPVQYRILRSTWWRARRKAAVLGADSVLRG